MTYNDRRPSHHRGQTSMTSVSDHSTTRSCNISPQVYIVLTLERGLVARREFVPAHLDGSDTCNTMNTPYRNLNHFSPTKSEYRLPERGGYLRRGVTEYGFLKI